MLKEDCEIDIEKVPVSNVATKAPRCLIVGECILKSSFSILVLLLNIQYFSDECNKAILLKIDFNNFVINA